MIIIEDFVKSFGLMIVVRGISFFVNDGEIYGFFGFNGSGKLMMMKIVVGIILFMLGKVMVNGIDVFVNFFKVKEIVGYIFEILVFYESFILMEFFLFVGSIR